MDSDRGILIIEDSDDDYDAVIRALRRELASEIPVGRCEDGQHALNYLFRDCAGRGIFPKVILLDLNMPGIDGRQVLAEIKTNDRLRLIPVIVMTHSDAPRDIQDCYRIGANSYLRKPLEWSDFVAAMRHMKEYWIDTVILPEI